MLRLRRDEGAKNQFTVRVPTVVRLDWTEELPR